MIEREAYADGQVDDGRILHLPNIPEITFQHLLTKDMQQKGHGTVIMEDPAREGVMLTIGQVYDLYALTLLVIDEVEARSKRPQGTPCAISSSPSSPASSTPPTSTSPA